MAIQARTSRSSWASAGRLSIGTSLRETPVDRLLLMLRCVALTNTSPLALGQSDEYHRVCGVSNFWVDLHINPWSAWCSPPNP
jgi:hypothetical protein